MVLYKYEAGIICERSILEILMFDNLARMGNIVYLIIIVAAFLFSCLLTPLMRRYAIKFGIVDKADGKRKFQKKPIAYLGGIAIAVSFLAVCLAVGFFTQFYDARYTVILAGSVLILALGFLDDLFDLNPFVKFFGQIAVATLTAVVGGAVEYVAIFGVYVGFGALSVPITVLWIVLVTNSVNLIDGLDGLACGVSVFSLMALFLSALIIGDEMCAVLACALCGAALGFLPYNLYPASIFMGDAGALFLGYVMSCISVFGFFKGQALFSIVVPSLILALPVTDAIALFFTRLSKGRSPFSADRLHIHHKLLDMGLTPRQAVHVLYALSSLFSISAIVYIKHKILAVGIAVLTFALMALIKFLPRLPKISTRKKSDKYGDETNGGNI